MVVVIEGTGGVRNLGAGKNETVGGADIFMEFAERKLNVVKEGVSEEFASNSHGETILGEHGLQGAFGGEAGGEMGVRDEMFATIGVKFADGADGEFGMVTPNEAVEVGEEVGGDGVVGVNEGDELTTTDSKAGVAGAGKTLVGLMEDASAGVASREAVTDVAANVGGTVVNEDDF